MAGHTVVMRHPGETHEPTSCTHGQLTFGQRATHGPAFLIIDHPWVARGRLTSYRERGGGRTTSFTCGRGLLLQNVV